MAVEWELVKGYLKIAVDPATNSYKLQFYNTTAAAWEDVLEYNPATKEFVLAPTLRDGVKYSFGTDKDYSLYYDAAADAIRLMDEVNVANILEIGRNGIINIINNLADGVKFYFGTDKDYSLYYDATAGEWKLRDEINAADLLRLPKNTRINDILKQGAIFELTGIALFGLVADRPAAGVAGRFWLSTDTWELSYDDGTAWNSIGILGGLDLTAHQARHAAGGADAIAGLAYTQFATDSIQATVDIPIVAAFAGATVAADALGTPSWPHTTVKVDTATLKHLKSAKLIVDYAWAATADGTIQLYDTTAAAVLGESTAKIGGESAEWEEFAVSGLVAGNTMVVRANVTAAGAAGETATLYRAILRLTLGVS
jgi:hypothetical protein